MSARPNFEDVPRRLSDQLASFLREEIYSGQLPPGQRLQEVEMCERLNVSRAPLREAILALRTDGLVEVRPHRGATVVTLTQDDIGEVFTLRRLLEPVAARAAAVRHDDHDLESLKLEFDRLRAASVRDEPLPLALAHAAFHRGVARSSGMSRLASFVDVLGTQMLAFHGVGYATRRSELELIVEDHGPILNAILAGDGPAAEERMHSHFRPIEPMLEAYSRLAAAPDRASAPRRQDRTRPVSRPRA